MKRITQAIILAGGAGTRLKPFTDKDPKPMVLVNGKPFLEHLVILLRNNGIQEIVILTGYLGEKIEKYFKDGSSFGIKIRYSYTPFKEKEENESGIRLKNAEHLLNDFFLLMYCDNYWPLQLETLIQFFTTHPSDALITAFSNLDKSTKSNTRIEGGYVTKYNPTRTQKNLNGVDIGFFIINKKILNLLPKTNSKFESLILPQLIKRRRLSGYLTDQKYYSISDPERVKITAKFLSSKKAVFLDRDGVINKKPAKADYVKSWSEFEFLPASIEAIKLLNKKGYKVFIISNQAGIARGAMTENDLKNIHQNMLKVLKKNGAKIDGIYYCPHGWDERCDCRKPKPGLLLQASRENFIDLTKTAFIGDDGRDMEAGNSVGCITTLVSRNKNLLQIVHSLP